VAERFRPLGEGAGRPLTGVRERLKVGDVGEASLDRGDLGLFALGLVGGDIECA
jgi:hypothetical protein